jgi:CheY-like chemotaxis protein
MATGRDLGRPVEILLVEDSPSDALLTREALKRGKMQNTVHHVSDGEEALRFLRRQAPYADVAEVDVVLLDLNMPRMDGRAALKEIRADEHLKCLPVIVLTTSSAEKDVLQAYGLAANCYIVKPVDLDQFFQAMQALDCFWLTWVALPVRA